MPHETKKLSQRLNGYRGSPGVTKGSREQHFTLSIELLYSRAKVTRHIEGGNDFSFSSQVEAQNGQRTMEI